MKDWCMKHPILTFLIIDEVITAIKSIVTHKALPSMTRDIGYRIEDAVEQAKAKKAEESKQPIGFAVLGQRVGEKFTDPFLFIFYERSSK